MGIELSSNFDVKTGLPLDSRTVVADLTARDAIDDLVRYEGMVVYVESEEAYYKLVGGITDGDWAELVPAGIITVADLTARDAIDPSDRVEGETLVYVTSEAKTYQLVGGITDDDWQEIGSGSGSGFGGKNYFEDPSYDDNVDATRGYKEFSDLVAASGFIINISSHYIRITSHGLTTDDPLMFFGTGAVSPLTNGVTYYAIVDNANDFGVSLTPGGARINLSSGSGTLSFRFYYTPTHLAASVNTSTPQASVGSLQIAFTNSGVSAVGEGIELGTKTIDLEDRGKTLFLSVKVANVDTDYVDNDWIFKVVDLTNGSLMSLFTGYQLKRLDTSYLIPIYTLSTTAQVAVSVHMNADNATGDFVATFGTWKLTPETLIPGVIITPWTTFTPTGTWTTNVTYTGVWRRVMDSIESRGSIVFSGANSQGDLLQTAAQAFNGLGTLTVDTAKLPTPASSNDGVAVGVGMYEDSGLVNRGGITVGYFKSTNQFRFLGSSFSDLSSPGTPITWASGDSVAWQYSVPIVEYASFGMLSTTETMMRGAQAIYYGNAGQALTANVTNIPFATKVRDTLSSWSGSVFTAPATGLYAFAGSIFLTASNNGDVASYVNGADAKNASQVQTSTEGKLVSGARYLEAGQTLSLRFSASVTLLNTALYHHISIWPIFDPTVFSVYGQTLLAPASAYSSGGRVSYAITAGQYGDLDSELLPPGEYDLFAQAEFFSNGATTTTLTGLGVSTTTGNSSTGLIIGETFLQETKNTSTGTSHSISLMVPGIVVTSPTTYYLKGYAVTAITNLQIGWSWRFRKVK